MKLTHKMKIILAIQIVLVFQLQLFAQFNAPVATCYNKDNDKYYVCNYGTKSIIKLDRFGSKSTFISGLTAPNNIAYASLPIGNGFLILDSNVVKLYDTNGNYQATETVSGAKKLSDLVIDDVNEAIYTCDVGRNVIYKTTFGGPPFYLPSTVIYISNIAKPSALILQKSRNRLLVVQDTVNSKIVAVNLSNASTSDLYITGLDNLVGIAEDGQGNIYLSSQGNKNLYQVNKYLSGAPKKLIAEPKPGDITIVPEKDEWAYTCILCGTVYIARLHIFGPAFEESKCPGDSLISYRNILMKNIGTFENGNEFICEMSNASGSFATGVKQIGKVKDTLVPEEIKGKLSITASPSAAYKYRWRSTKPPIVSGPLFLEIKSPPKVKIAESDSVYTCKNSKVFFGNTNTINSNLIYNWSISSGILDSIKTARNSATLGENAIVKLWVEDRSTTCQTQDSTFVFVIDKPDSMAFANTFKTCAGSSLEIGSKPQAGIQYLWNTANNISDSTVANPIFKSNEEGLYQFSIELIGNGNCRSKALQSIMVNELPKVNLLPRNITFCSNTQFIASVFVKGNKQIIWKFNNKREQTGNTSSINVTDTGEYKVVITDSITNCSAIDSGTISVFPNIIPVLKAHTDKIVVVNSIAFTNFVWYRNDTMISEQTGAMLPKISAAFKVCATDTNKCIACSDTVQFKIRMTNQFQRNTIGQLQVYPNPCDDFVQLSGKNINNYTAWRIFDVNGKICVNGIGSKIQTASLNSGLYYLQVEQSNIVFQKK